MESSQHSTGLAQRASSLKRMLALAVVAIALVGCQKKESSTSVQTRAVGPNGIGTQQTMVDPSISLRGVIYTDNAYQDDFNDLVRVFYERFFPLPQDGGRYYIGWVSAMAEDNTGLFFGGVVQLEGGMPLRSLQNGQRNITAASRIAVKAWDAFDGGTQPPELPVVYLTNGQGTVSGNYVHIRFSDNFGWVEMEGQYDQQVFSGSFSFDNQRRYDGTGPGGAGTIGHFEIPTCAFFQCQ